MDISNYITLENVAIAVLSISLLVCTVMIKHLKKLLVEKHNKQTVPVLIPHIDSYNTTFYLKNDGDCDAKDIFIPDVNLSFDYDFKKTLMVKFESIKSIRSKQQEPMSYRIFDEKYEITQQARESLIAHLSNSSFEMKIIYANTKNAAFTAIIFKDKNGFSIKSIDPV